MAFDSPPVAPQWYLPGGELDARLEMLINGTWTDFSSRVFDGAEMTIGRGHPDESTTASPSSASGTLDNHDGVLSNLNPVSQYYGQLPLNTDVRVSVPAASSYLRLEADQVSYAECVASSAVQTASDFEVWCDVDADNWYAPQILAARWNPSSSNNVWAFMSTGDGTLTLQVSKDGGLGLPFRSDAVVPKVHGRLSVRVTFNHSTGTATFYTGAYCQNWVQLGDAITISQVYTPFSGNPRFTAGGAASTSDLTSQQWQGHTGGVSVTSLNGRVYATAFLPLGGVVSSALLTGDFTVLTPGTTSWTSAEGLAWDFNGTNAEISNRDYRFHGEAASWPQSWTPGDPNARVALSAGGLLRRVGSTNVPANSPMYRAYTRLTGFGNVPAAYWTMEDASNSTQIASGLGGAPMRIAGTPQLASSNVFACSAPLLQLNKAILSGSVPPAQYTTVTSGNSGVFRWLMEIPSGGDAAGASIVRVLFTGGTLGYVDLTYTSSTVLTLTAFDSNGNSIGSVATTYTAGGVAARWSIEVQPGSAGQFNTALVWLIPGSSSGLEVSLPAITGTIGRISKVVFNANGLLQGTVVGHASVQTAWGSLFDMSHALTAYAGEAAGVRFQRICAEEGIQFRGMGNIQDTQPMSVQTIETVATLLQECVDVDRGIWFEPRQCLGWGYRTRASLGNQAATVPFDYAQDHLSDTLEPTVDDQTPKNDVTVTSQAGGSSARKVLDDGSAMAVGTIGRYDTEITVNLGNDSLLDSEAGWILHALTVNEPRYKAINCDLANGALAALYWQILEADMGDRITVRNPPVWLPPGLIDQVAQGVTETVSRKGLSESWNGIPSTPWNVAYADDVVFGRADTDGSTLAAALPAPLLVDVPDAKATGWSVYGGSVAPSAAPATSSIPQWALWTSDATAFGNISGPGINITPGTYAVSGFIYSPTAVSARPGLGVFASGAPGAAHVTDSLSSVAVPAGVITPFCVLSTVPSGGGWASPIVQLTAPTNGEKLYVTTFAVWQASAATVSVATSTAGSPLWTTTTADFPFDIGIGGERFTVAKITGTSSPQAFTMARGVNGVSKAQVSGADVRLWTPPIASL